MAPSDTEDSGGQRAQFWHPQMFWAVFLTVVFIVLMGYVLSRPAAQLHDNNLITDLSVFRTSRVLTLEQAMSQPFTPSDGVLVKGNSREQVWFRLQTRAIDQPVVLTVQPPYLRHIRVHVFDASGRVHTEEQGMVVPFQNRELKAFSFAFPLNFDPDGFNAEVSVPQAYTVFVEVNSETSVMSVQIMALSQFLQLETSLNFAFGVYIGLSAMLVLLATVVWAVTRERLWIRSVWFDAVAFNFGAIQFGLVSQFIPESWASSMMVIYCLSQTLLTMGICQFYPKLYGDFGLTPRQLVVYRPYPLVLLVSLGLIAAGFYAEALMLNNIYIFMLVLASFYFVYKARIDEPYLLMMFRVFTLGVVLMSAFWMSSILLGMKVSREYLFYALAPSNLFSMFMILMILAYKTMLKGQERQRLEVAEREARTRLVMEHQKLEETTSFLGMVIHEVKNPLNHIRFAVRNLQMRATQRGENDPRLDHIVNSVTAVDDVLERSLQVDMLEQGALQVQMLPWDLDELVAQGVARHLEHERVTVRSPGPMVVVLDADVFTLVFRNLLDNALKYSPKGSPVFCDLEQAAEGVVLRVRNAVGSAGRPDPERLFKKYYHNQAVRPATGMGLGLYWVQQVLRRMNGDIALLPGHEEVVFELWLQG